MFGADMKMPYFSTVMTDMKTSSTEILIGIDILVNSADESCN